MRATRIGPSEHNIHIPQASDIELGFRLTRGNAAKDLTAATVYLTVKSRRSTSDGIVLSKINAPGDHNDAENGETVFSISKTDFSAYEQPSDVRFVYEVRVDDTPYLQGTLVLEPVTGRS